MYGCTKSKCALSRAVRSVSSGSVRAPLRHRYSRSSLGMRDGVGLMKAGSSRFRVIKAGVMRWGYEDADEEFVESEFVRDGTESCEEANDARRRLCCWSFLRVSERGRRQGVGGWGHAYR